MVIAALCGLVACSASSNPGNAALRASAPSDAGPATSTSPTDAGAGTSSSATPARIPEPLDAAVVTAVRTTVRAWSDALDRHDLKGLAACYDDVVAYYGDEWLQRAVVVERKRVALAQAPAFHQTIVGDIDVASGDGGLFTATFVKRSGSGHAVAKVRARLSLRRTRESRLVIHGESDQPSDDVNARTQACDDAASRAVHVLPSVRGLEQDVAPRDGGSPLALGGMGPIDNGDGTVTFGIGVHSDERFEARVWYTVNRKTGSVTVTVDGADEVLAPDARQAVERACKP